MLYLSQEPHLYLALGALFFSIGFFTVLTRRNVIGILLGLELMLNAAGVNFVVFATFTQAGDVLISGHLFALFLIILAAAEAVVALAILLVVYAQRKSVDMNQLNELRG